MLTSRPLRALLALGLLAIALLFAAPVAMASDGVGLVGRTNDKMVTFICFGVIAFFPLLVTVLALIQNHLEKRKDQRRYDLERLS